VQGFIPADLVSCDVGDLSFAGTNGSLSADPLFLDPSEHDYRLRYGSPCVEMADPNYVLPSNSYDNRGYGAWRRMDGDHDGQVETDIGAYERGGLDAWQDGSGVGSQVHLEIDTGPFRGWFLAYGPFGPGPIQPLPTAGSTHPYFWLDVLQYGLFSSGIQGASGRFTLSFTVTTPTVIGIPLPLQALGVEWQSSPVFHFTNADLLVIR